MVSTPDFKEIALASLLSFSLFICGMLIPVLALPLMLLYSFPTLALTFRQGTSSGVISAVVTASALFFVFPPMLPIVYFQTFGLLGVFLALAAKKIKNAPDLVVAGVVIALVCKLSGAFIVYAATGTNFFAPDSAEMERALTSFAESGLSALSPAASANIKKNLAQTVNDMVLLIPFSVILFSAAEVLFGLMLASRLHKKATGEAFFNLPPFSTWSFPQNILFAMIVGLICELIAQRAGNSYFLRQISMNLVAITRTLFIIQGLSVSCNYMEAKAFPRALKIAMIILTPLVSVLGDMLSILGILDIWFNLRKRIRRS